MITQSDHQSNMLSTYQSSVASQVTVAQGEGGLVSMDEVHLRDYLAISLRRRWLMLCAFVTVFIAGMLLTITRPHVYQSTAKILVTSSGGGISSDDISIISDLKALTHSRSVDTQVEILNSPDLLNEAFNSLVWPNKSHDFGADRLPEGTVAIVAKPDTDIINITAQACNPAAAAALANNVAHTYFSRDLSRNMQATRQVREYVETNMRSVEQELAEANAALSRYKQSSGMIAPEAQVTKTAEHLATLQSDYEDAVGRWRSNAEILHTLNDKLQSERQTLISSTTITHDPRYNTILDSLTKMNSERAALLQEFTPDSDEVKAVDGRITAEEAKLKDVANASVVSSQTRANNPLYEKLREDYTSQLAVQAATVARMHSLETALQSGKAASAKLPEKERQLAELMQRVSLAKKTYEALKEKYQTLRIGEQSMLPNGTMVSEAHANYLPIRPRPVQSAILFFLLGVIVAVLLAIIAERLDDRVHTQEMIEQLTGANTMSVLPQLASGPINLFETQGKHSSWLESFRILRNNIAFASVDRPLEVMAVSSPGPGEGKSTACSNLAAAMAMDGKRVIVVDFDLRSPSMHQRFNLSRDIGFTNVLTGAYPLETAIQHTGMEGLDFLASGPLPPNPTELLNSLHTRELLRKLVHDYDLVLLDCPPCSGLSDVQVVSTLIDGLLLVVAIDQTLRNRLQFTMRLLAQAKAPMIGTVINRLDAHTQDYYYYYYSDDAEHQKGKHGKRRRKSSALRDFSTAGKH